MRYHRGVEAGPDGPVHRGALVGLHFTRRHEQEHFIRVRLHLDVRQSFGPGRRSHQPHEGEDHRHYEILSKNKSTLLPQLSLGHFFTSITFSSVLTYVGFRFASFHVYNENTLNFNSIEGTKQPAKPSLTIPLHYRRSLYLDK